MKKLAITLIAFLLGFGLLAQTTPSFIVDENPVPSERSNEYVCEQDAVFSQVFPDANTGYYAEETFQWTRAADDYTASIPFTSMRFWGVNYLGCPIGATQTFTIRFYERNLVDPNIPGTEVNSFTVAATPLDIGISMFSSPVYQIDIDFGNIVTLLDGWVSVTRLDSGDGCEFVWVAYDDGLGNERSYDGSWINGATGNTGNLLFCFSSTPPIPVSNWAIILGVLLIGTFIVVRYRTRLA